jgi:hypothetical protein
MGGYTQRERLNGSIKRRDQIKAGDHNEKTNIYPCTLVPRPKRLDLFQTPVVQRYLAVDTVKEEPDGWSPFRTPTML